jgi:hypothetical protein
VGAEAVGAGTAERLFGAGRDGRRVLAAVRKPLRR